MKRAQSGMTLVELLITVAIVSLLAALAGVSYKRYSARGRSAEVYAMFGELRAKEEAYRAETNRYLSVTSDEGTLFPELLSEGEPRAKVLTSPPAGWTALGINPPRSMLYCSYTAIGGPAGSWSGVQSDGSASAAGTFGKDAFNNTVPSVPWFYLFGMCDNDGQPKVERNATFVTTMNSTVVIEQNPGR
jgi:prepilin-type N-terminal cleavage/methylation domain-containing protein